MNFTSYENPGMDRYPAGSATWQRIVRLLGEVSNGRVADDAGLKLDLPLTSRSTNSDGAVAIVLLERVSSRTATVSWSDPGSCNYGDQVWIRVTASRAGVCALSGAPIARGEAVYRPRRARAVQANAAAMILASAVDRSFAERQMVG